MTIVITVVACGEWQIVMTKAKIVTTLTTTIYIVIIRFQILIYMLLIF